MGCIIGAITLVFKAVWLVLKLIGKVFVFLMFKLGLIFIAVYAAAMEILSAFFFPDMDIYGKNLVYYLIGMGLMVILTVILLVRRRRKKLNG